VLSVKSVVKSFFLVIRIASKLSPNYIRVAMSLISQNRILDYVRPLISIRLFDHSVRVADFSEAGRDFEEAHISRKMAESDLDEAFRYVVGQRLRFLLLENRPIIPRTIHLWNSLQK